MLLCTTLEVLTYSGAELHGDDRSFVSLVLPGTISKLRHPAFRRPVRTAGVHQPVDDQQGDDGVGVALHALSKKEKYFAVRQDRVKVTTMYRVEELPRFCLSWAKPGYQVACSDW